MYEAEFTSEGAVHVICQRCKEVFPPGTELFYMHNINPSYPGRKLCEGCYKYYHEKGTTRRRSGMPLIIVLWFYKSLTRQHLNLQLNLACQILACMKSHLSRTALFDTKLQQLNGVVSSPSPCLDQASNEYS